MQPARNHQVQYQPEIVLDSDGDPLPDAPKLADRPSLDLRRRGLDCPKQKWAGDANPLQTPAGNARFERGQVRSDVRQFRHSSILRRRTPKR